MATWQGTLLGTHLVQTAPRKRVLEVQVLFTLFDRVGDAEVQDKRRMTVRYPLVFAGMTQDEALRRIRDDGAGGVPSLRALGAALAQDFEDAGVFRSVTFPVDFVP